VPLTQYCSSDKTEKNEMCGACSAGGGEEMCVQSFVVKPEGKRPLGSLRSRWEDNILIDLQEVGFGTWTGSI
jgi:hypothetical protein